MLHIMRYSFHENVFIFKFAIEAYFLTIRGLFLQRHEKLVPPFKFWYLLYFDVELNGWLQRNVWLSKGIDLVFLLSGG